MIQNQHLLEFPTASFCNSGGLLLSFGILEMIGAKEVDDGSYASHFVAQTVIHLFCGVFEANELWKR